MAAREKKTAKPKPQLKNLDDLFALDGEGAQGKLQIQEIPVFAPIPFEGHPFRLYEGERLDDMVESVKANGVLVPVIVRRKIPGSNEALEILAGHNRVNAAKIAGVMMIPAIILDGISDEEAMVYVVETNLMQRSFADMTHSEKAAVIAMHHGKMFSQGKRNDILEQLKIMENPELANTAEAASDSNASDENTKEPDTGIRTSEKIAAMYSLSRNTIARYLRISQLNAPLKMMLDNGKITFLVAVELSFLTKQEQEWLAECLEDGFTVNAAKTAVLREQSKAGALDLDTIANILAGQNAATENKPRNVKINGDIYSRYFKPEQSAKEVEVIVEEALAMYFAGRRSAE